MIYRLVHNTARANAIEGVRTAPEGWIVEVKEPTRTLEQSAKFHAICHDISRQKEFAGKLRTPAQWKVLLVSGHAVATNSSSEIIPGLEGEWVNLRESTAQMSTRRIASLIEYTLAWCADNGIKLREPARIEEWSKCQGM